MSTSGVASMNARPVIRRRSAHMAIVLPYLLSMPALLTCIGILVPFGTAIYYSLQRYNLAFPSTRGFIWFANYISLFRDASFWQTVAVSMELHRAHRRTGAAARARHRAAAVAALAGDQPAQRSVDAAVDGGARDRRHDVEADDQCRFRHSQLLRFGARFSQLQVGDLAAERPVHRRTGGHVGVHAVHDHPAAGRPARPAHASPSRPPSSTACRAASCFSASCCRCCCLTF